MIVKVFKSTANELPKGGTPISAAKDVRADIGMMSKTFMFDADFVYVEPYVETGLYSDIDFILTEGNDLKKAVVIHPNGRCLIPSGLKMQAPLGYSFDMRPRSGLALKFGLTLTNSPGTIDNDYRGDVGVIIANTSNESVVIVDGERLAQIKLVQDFEWEWQQVEKESDLSNTIRGEGGYGHTGTK